MISSSSVKFNRHHQHDNHHTNWTVSHLYSNESTMRTGKRVCNSFLSLKRVWTFISLSCKGNRIDRQTFKQFEQLTNFWINIAHGQIAEKKKRKTIIVEQTSWTLVFDTFISYQTQAMNLIDSIFLFFVRNWFPCWVIAAVVIKHQELLRMNIHVLRVWLNLFWHVTFIMNMNKLNAMILYRDHCITTVWSIVVSVQIIIRHHHHQVHPHSVHEQILFDHVIYHYLLIRYVNINVHVIIERIINDMIIVFLNTHRCSWQKTRTILQPQLVTILILNWISFEKYHHHHQSKILELS